MIGNDNKNAHKLSCKKAMKLKASGKPRRPLSAYNFFFSEQRQKILKERDAMPQSDRLCGPEMFAAMGKEVSARWKRLTDVEKKKYKDLASKEKSRYNSEMVEFTGRVEVMPMGTSPHFAPVIKKAETKAVSPLTLPKNTFQAKTEAILPAALPQIIQQIVARRKASNLLAATQRLSLLRRREESLYPEPRFPVFSPQPSADLAARVLGMRRKLQLVRQHQMTTDTFMIPPQQWPPVLLNKETRQVLELAALKKALKL